MAIYSHDTFGLGHLTRSTRIARGVLQAFPEGSILLLSGSPIAHRFSFPPRVDYLKLPSVVKSGPETYDARELNISRRRVRLLRAQLILDAIDVFRPHLLFVDNVPLGMKGELLPALQWLKTRRPEARIHLNLRDVLDAPEVIRANWNEWGVPQILRELYDAIHIFGSPTIFNAIQAYDLPRDKSAFLNYIAPARDETFGGEHLPPAVPACRRILVTAGGGGDGIEIMQCVLQLQAKLKRMSPYQFHIVTGPLMDRQSRLDLIAEARGVPTVTIHEYVEKLASWMRECDLVLSMGGYNTLCEVMALAQRSIVVPRIHPRTEQEIRARALEARGILRVIDPRDLNWKTLERTLERSFESHPTLRTAQAPPLTGIAELSKRLAGAIDPPISSATPRNHHKRSPRLIPLHAQPKRTQGETS